MRILFFAAAASVLLAACLGTGSAASIRYYSGEAAPSDEARATSGSHRLAMRDVRSAGHLRERMARRVGDVEVTFRELDRWTETPVAYLERALYEELFELHGLQRSEAREAPTLDVELIAFEQVLDGVRAAFSMRLTGPDGHSLYDRTIDRSFPLDERTPTGVALSLSIALRYAASQAAEEILSVLASH